jgi:hypothetical protein
MTDIMTDIITDIEQLLSTDEEIKFEFVDDAGIKWAATNKRILNRKESGERIKFQDLDYRHITSFIFDTQKFRYLILVGLLLILFSLILLYYLTGNHSSIVKTPVFADITFSDIIYAILVILIIKGVQLIYVGIIKRYSHCRFFAAGLYRQQPIIIKVKNKKGEENIIKFLQIIRV